MAKRKLNAIYETKIIEVPELPKQMVIEYEYPITPATFTRYRQSIVQFTVSTTLKSGRKLYMRRKQHSKDIFSAEPKINEELALNLILPDFIDFIKKERNKDQEINNYFDDLDFNNFIETGKINTK